MLEDITVYKDLDGKIFNIGNCHGFDIQSHVKNDGSYCIFFIADGNNPMTQAGIKKIEDLGLKSVRKINTCNPDRVIHYYIINNNR